MEEMLVFVFLGIIPRSFTIWRNHIKNNTLIVVESPVMKIMLIVFPAVAFMITTQKQASDCFIVPSIAAMSKYLNVKYLFFRYFRFLLTLELECYINFFA